MRRAFVIAGFAAVLSAAPPATAIAHENSYASEPAWRLQTTAFSHVAARGPPLDEPRWLGAAHGSLSSPRPIEVDVITIMPPRALGSSLCPHHPYFVESLRNPNDLWHASLSTPGFGARDTAADDRGSQLVEHTILSEEEMRDLCLGVFLPILISVLVILVELIVLSDRDVLVAEDNRDTERTFEAQTPRISPVQRRVLSTPSNERRRTDTLDRESTRCHMFDVIPRDPWRIDRTSHTRAVRSPPPWHRGSGITPVVQPRHHHMARCAIRAPAGRESDS